jgi:dynein light intermediate chain 1
MKGAAWEERTDWVQQVLRAICLARECTASSVRWIVLQRSLSRKSGLSLYRLTRADGASLFYTAPTQPNTYTLLRSYLLHRLYSIPPPLTSDNSAAQSTPIPTSHASARFPFPHRANVLDRDAVMVPSGWDSWGKINVLREGFDPARVGSALEASLGGLKEGQGVQDGEGLERIWESMIPEVERVKVGRIELPLVQSRRLGNPVINPC